MDERIYYLALNMAKGIGAGKKRELLTYFDNNITKLFNTNSFEITKLSGNQNFLNDKESLLSKAEKELETTIAQNIGITTINSEDYPKNLLSTPDPPITLYYKGSLSKSDFNSIAVVGSRKATNYGLDNSFNLGLVLGKHNITVVSGLAQGIDAEAHKGTLKANGRTVAVLGCGIDRYFPKQNKELQLEIEKRGCVLSEFPLNTEPKGFHFPMRNRIIAGLSVGVVVVEGSKDSGSLYTADFALNYGRELYAFPGSVHLESYSGTHLLIKKGAKLIINGYDLMEDLYFILDINAKKDQITNENQNITSNIDLEQSNEIPYDQNENLNEDELKILNQLSNREKKSLDSIVELSNLKIEKVMSCLTSLVLKGKCNQLDGNYYIRN